jgi:hypothetical protein
MSGLGAIGSFLGGFSQTLTPELQQAKDDTAAGLGIYALSGQTPPQQGGLGGLGSLLLGQGGVPPVGGGVQAPQIGQGGVAQSPGSVQSPMVQSGPSSLPAGQPMTATAGQTPPQAAPAAPPAPQQTSQAQQSPQYQGQQQQTSKAPDLSMHDGMFDFHTLAKALTDRKMPPQQIGRIMRNPSFVSMLNNQGLQQYRMLGLDERMRHDRELEDLKKEAQESTDRHRRFMEGYDSWKTKLTGVAQQYKLINDAYDARKTIIQKQVQAGNVTPEAADKQLKDLESERDTKMGQVTSDYMKSAPTEGGEQSTSGSGGSQGAGTEQDPVKVKTPQDAQALKPGTIYETPDGQVMVR